MHPSDALTNDLPPENPPGRQRLLAGRAAPAGSFRNAGTTEPTAARRKRPFPGESGSSCLIWSKSALTCCCRVPPAATGARVLPGHRVPKQRHRSARASTRTLPPTARTRLRQSHV